MQDFAMNNKSYMCAFILAIIQPYDITFLVSMKTF